MRLKRAEPERCSCGEGVGFVEAKKEGQSEEHEDGGLAEDDAEQRWRKTKAEPIEMTAGGAEEGPKNSDGGDEEGEHRQRPGKCGGGGREKAEGVGERQGPGRVAHVVGAGAAESGGALDGVDGVRVVGIAVLDELMAGGPVDDEVAAGDGGWIEG